MSMNSHSVIRFRLKVRRIDRNVILSQSKCNKTNRHDADDEFVYRNIHTQIVRSEEKAYKKIDGNGYRPSVLNLQKRRFFVNRIANIRALLKLSLNIIFRLTLYYTCVRNTYVRTNTYVYQFFLIHKYQYQYIYIFFFEYQYRYQYICIWFLKIHMYLLLLAYQNMQVLNLLELETGLSNVISDYNTYIIVAIVISCF
jgi:hypothetical protein